MTTTEEQGWLPGMEPQEVEDRKLKRRRGKEGMAKEVVPLEIEWVPGFKMRAFAVVSSEKRRGYGRPGRRRVD